MSKLILATGTTLPDPFEDIVWIHVPIIEIFFTDPSKEEAAAIFSDWLLYTHVIVTSQNGVKALKYHLDYFDIPEETLLYKNVIAVGAKTAQELINAQIPSREDQEGIIDLLSEKELKEAYILCIGSSLSRKTLMRFLERKKIRFQWYVGYSTQIKQNQKFDLKRIDGIYFSSPSTVEAFFYNSSLIPDGWDVIVKGESTKQKLDQLYPSVRSRMLDEYQKKSYKRVELLSSS